MYRPMGNSLETSTLKEQRPKEAQARLYSRNVSSTATSSCSEDSYQTLCHPCHNEKLPFYLTFDLKFVVSHSIRREDRIIVLPGTVKCGILPRSCHTF